MFSPAVNSLSYAPSIVAPPSPVHEIHKTISPNELPIIIPLLAQERRIALNSEEYKKYFDATHFCEAEAYALWAIAQDNFLSEDECYNITQAFPKTSDLLNLMIMFPGRLQAFALSNLPPETLLSSKETLIALSKLDDPPELEGASRLAKAFQGQFSTPHWFKYILRHMNTHEIVNAALHLYDNNYHPLYVFTSPLSPLIPQDIILRFKIDPLLKFWNQIYYPNNKHTILETYFALHRARFLELINFPSDTPDELDSLIKLNLILDTRPIFVSRKCLINEAVNNYRPDIENFFHFFSDSDLPFLFSAMMSRQFFEISYMAICVPIKDFGRVINTWEDLLRKWLIRIDLVPVTNDTLPLPHVAKKVSKLTIPNTLYATAGRTSVYLASNHFLFFKRRKISEPLAMLQREAVMNTAIRASQHFRSKPPEVIGFWNSHLVYKAESIAPITYAHDPNIDFPNAQRVYMHDIGVLMRCGYIYTALADLFHNNEADNFYRDDKGRYIPLIGLVNDYFLGCGAGRLTAWLKAIEYPNVGVGLRDLADVEKVSTLADPNSFYFQHYFSLLDDRFNDCKFPSNSTLILSNAMAEALLIDMLIIGRRASGDWKCKDDCNRIARQVLSGAVHLLHGYTKADENILYRLLENSGIDWERLGMQMLFWMNNSNTGYLPYVKEGFLPKNLYEDDAEVTVADTSEMRGWNDDIGFSINGTDADLGTVNGPFPIVEAVKLWYLCITWMHALRKLDLSDHNLQGL